MIRAVIYDLDGTLIDSRRDLVASVQALLAEQRRPPLPDRAVISFVGEGARRLVSRALAASDPALEARTDELMPRWFQLYAERMLDTTVAYPGVDALLREPPDLRAVLTNKPGRFARQILAGLGMLDRFREVVGGDEAPRKPDPAGLQALCARMGVRPSEALLVGDSPVDVQTGAAAGMRVCAALWGLVPEADLRAAGPAFFAREAADVAALLERLRDAPP